jgi:glyoxylase-like metal-dependent hydrolase (beta-lactamase superfamily II)
MKIIENVYQLDASKQSCIYLIREKENILIDTGYPFGLKKISAELSSLGTPVEDIDKILLTHHDLDHVGNAQKLQLLSGAEVYAPQNDIPFIIGKKKRPGIKGLVGTIIPNHIPAITGSYENHSDFSGITPLYAPGHTPGHTIFLYKKILFAGDLFVVKNGKFRLLADFFTWNKEILISSVKKLPELDYDTICLSHGGIATHDAELDKFIDDIRN